MTEHVCKWKCMVDGWDHTLSYECTKCDTVLNGDEVESRLNEYETLKAATERLSAEDATWAADFIKSDWVGSRGWIGEEAEPAHNALQAYADILEEKVIK